jgi:hypothetical protein
MCVTVDGVRIGELDLLTTRNCNYSAMGDIHTLDITTL